MKRDMNAKENTRSPRKYWWNINVMYAKQAWHSNGTCKFRHGVSTQLCYHLVTMTSNNFQVIFWKVSTQIRYWLKSNQLEISHIVFIIACIITLVYSKSNSDHSPTSWDRMTRQGQGVEMICLVASGLALLFGDDVVPVGFIRKWHPAGMEVGTSTSRIMIWSWKCVESLGSFQHGGVEVFSCSWMRVKGAGRFIGLLCWRKS